MKLIKSSFTILEPQGYDLISIKKFIEIAARVCYKSEDKITDESYQVMYDSLVKRGHTAMLEHGTVYLTFPESGNADTLYKYLWNKYSEVVKDEGVCYVTTNMRVIEQNHWEYDFKYLSEPTKHLRRITVKFVCDRGVSHEFVRHRVFSFAQESTRFANYSKEKFGSECTYIEPQWYQDADPYHKERFIALLKDTESCYLDMLGKFEGRIPDKRFKTGFKGNPLTPQQARQVLPNALKTELIMTGTIPQWEDYFALRDDKAAHPDARALAAPLRQEFIKREYFV